MSLNSLSPFLAFLFLSLSFRRYRSRVTSRSSPVYLKHVVKAIRDLEILQTAATAIFDSAEKYRKCKSSLFFSSFASFLIVLSMITDDIIDVLYSGGSRCHEALTNRVQTTFHYYEGSKEEDNAILTMVCAYRLLFLFLSLFVFFFSFLFFSFFLFLFCNGRCNSSPSMTLC